MMARIRRALAERRERTAPSSVMLIAVTVGFVSVLIAIAIFTAPADEPADHFKEDGLVTAASASFLAMAAAFALISFFTMDRRVGRLRFLWLLATFVLFFLALDELMGFHEEIGSFIKHTSVGPSETFRNWNDAIVIGYGVVGLLAMLPFLPEILRHPRVAELIATGFGFFCIHTIIDSTQRRTDTSMMWEESAKLFAVAFVSLAMLVLARVTIHSRLSAESDLEG